MQIMEKRRNEDQQGKDWKSLQQHLISCEAGVTEDEDLLRMLRYPTAHGDHTPKHKVTKMTLLVEKGLLAHLIV